jgi:hypothetical protein
LDFGRGISPLGLTLVFDLFGLSLAFPGPLGFYAEGVK